MNLKFKKLKNCIPKRYITSKDEVYKTDELAQRNRSAGAGASETQRATVETIVRDRPKIGRTRVLLKI